MMSFGFFNALPSFQKYVNKILTKKLNMFVFIYFNGIFIYIENPNLSHINTV